MAQRRLFWKLYPSLIAIIVIAVALVVIFAERAIKAFYEEKTADDLASTARIVIHQVRGLAQAGEYAAADSLCKAIGRETEIRITLILPSGKVIGDSYEDPVAMENHNNRPEVLIARDSGVGSSIRYSSTVARRMMYVAVAADDHPETDLIIRASISIERLDEVLGLMRVRFLVGGLVVAVLAALVSFFYSRRITLPLEHLKKGAERFARGRFKRKLAVVGSDEIATLARAMNSMADEISRKLDTITEQRQTQEAIMTSMVEGVIAVDRDERVISINRAAAEFFEVSVKESSGRFLHEVVRNSAMQQLVSEILTTGESVAAELSTGGRKVRYLQASGSILQDAGGTALGAVVVINDVTRIQELETVRRDFVANVSHELRTPITLIKGYVETLQEGALHNGDDAERFLEIMARHTDQLNQLIEDLLSLSRIEQSRRIEFVSGSLRTDLEAAVAECEPKAREKNIRLEVEGDTEYDLLANHHLIQRAVGNLIDNAVKYSPENEVVEIKVAQVDKEVVISIIDHGCGIDRRHLPRIFERFYRVDKARSRELGGTGLGLAIVKHIVQTHRGRVTVDSTVGQGSVFSIHLPIGV